MLYVVLEERKARLDPEFREHCILDCFRLQRASQVCAQMTRFREEALHGNTGFRLVTSHPGGGREVSFLGL